MSYVIKETLVEKVIRFFAVTIWLMLLGAILIMFVLGVPTTRCDSEDIHPGWSYTCT